MEIPPLPVLRHMFEDVRSSICHLEIFETMINVAVDSASGVATMILNTKNYTLFKLARQKIRDYNGMKGIAFDTYEKAAFVAQHGITIYIPSQYKKMPIQLVMVIIQKNHPQLNYPYKIIERSSFTTEGPGFKGGRSRIGHQIILLEGSKEFMEGLAKFPARYPFEISRAWRLTIRGGKRADQTERVTEDLTDFSEQFRNSVLVGAAEDVMEEARKEYRRSPL